MSLGQCVLFRLLDLPLLPCVSLGAACVAAHRCDALWRAACGDSTWCSCLMALGRGAAVAKGRQELQRIASRYCISSGRRGVVDAGVGCSSRPVVITSPSSFAPVDPSTRRHPPQKSWRIRRRWGICCSPTRRCPWPSTAVTLVRARLDAFLSPPQVAG